MFLFNIFLLSTVCTQLILRQTLPEFSYHMLVVRQHLCFMQHFDKIHFHTSIGRKVNIYCLFVLPCTSSVCMFVYHWRGCVGVCVACVRVGVVVVVVVMVVYRSKVGHGAGSLSLLLCRSQGERCIGGATVGAERVSQCTSIGILLPRTEALVLLVILSITTHYSHSVGGD